MQDKKSSGKIKGGKVGAMFPLEKKGQKGKLPMGKKGK